ncbi:Transcription elongation factor B polypeptide 3 [Exaiptasia diaphana]|nr:Transcription elongation factor B polypeptide 3 [Exaiptasia diaphana]
MSSSEKYISKIKKKLSSSDLEEKKILKYLRHLEDVEVNVEILKNTGIGKLVNGLKKYEGIVGDAASSLVLKWKTTVTKQQESPTQENTSSSKSSKNSLLNSEIHESKRTERKTSEKYNQDSCNKKEESKAKIKGPSLQLCDISFGCETLPNKETSRPKKKHKSSTPASSSSTTSRENHNKYNNDYSSSLLPPLPTVASVNEALLPDIQPTYKPSRLPVFDDSPSKKKRDIEGTYVGDPPPPPPPPPVFSGRRNQTTPPPPPPPPPNIFWLQILVENIEALHDPPPPPPPPPHPVLLKCTPQQLLHLEDCNPEITEESDDLWQTHYRREFKTENRLKGLSWRDSYLAKHEEREERLKKINAKISASQAAKRPERQVKLAYVETIAKPPPQIRRKQAKFGTAHGAAGNEVPSNAISPIKHKSNHHKPIHTSNPSRHNYSSTHSQPNNTSLQSSQSTSTSLQSSHISTQSSAMLAQQRRPASAPLLKKTMKMFKNQRSINGAQIKRR